MDDLHLEAGDKLGDGQFEINRVIAEGGCAIVYAAHRRDGKAVAIKVLRKSALEQDDAAVKRLHREANLALELKHPNNVDVMTVGDTDDGHFFLVMELLNGKSLQQAMAAGDDFPPERIHAILIQLLGALGEIHSLGVVHRDVKPANVFLTNQPGSRDFIKLLDYGFAKLLDGHLLGETTTTPLTQRGIMLGTPGYFAPEVCQGDAVTPLADLYAVGIIGHEMFAGENAYTGTAMEKTMAQVKHDPKPLPKAIRKLALAAVIDKLLARRPANRYQSAEDAIADLKKIEHPAFTPAKRGWFGLW